jgi:hypothetical protein
VNSLAFETEARNIVDERLAELRILSFGDVLDLPGALAEDIVIAGKEVQLTTFRQKDLPNLPGAVLVTAQLARAGLGGLISYHYERALVYFADGEIREATQDELLATGG